MAAVIKINIPVDLFFSRNCPEPGRSREDSETAVRFREGFSVLFEVAINNGYACSQPESND